MVSTYSLIIQFHHTVSSYIVSSYILIIHFHHTVSSHSFIIPFHHTVSSHSFIRRFHQTVSSDGFIEQFHYKVTSYRREVEFHDKQLRLHCFGFPFIIFKVLSSDRKENSVMAYSVWEYIKLNINRIRDSKVTT